VRSLTIKTLTLEVTQKFKSQLSLPCKLQKKNKKMRKMVSLQPNKVVHPDHLTHKESQSPSIREKVSTPKEDQETSTTHQVRF
jgi:hypothetical protein